MLGDSTLFPVTPCYTFVNEDKNETKQNDMTRRETKQSNKAEVKPRTHHNGLDFFFFTFRWLARLLARNFDGETLVCVDPPKHIKRS
jgi:hypothetical protein